MRAYLCRLLRARYTVEAVADGASALAAARVRPPDLMLADVMMPRLDGLALVQHLRADPRTSTTPVLLLSARAGEEAQIEGLGVGADAYMSKPFSARELVARVDAQIALARLRREAARREQDLREEVQRRAREELESRVRERTAALTQVNAALQAEIAERHRAEAARTQVLRQLVTVQEEERRRISHDLHDRMGQHLTALMLLLKSLQTAAPGRPAAPEPVQQLQQSVQQLQQSVQQLQRIAEELRHEVHQLAVEMRPTALDDLGLHTALWTYVEEWTERSQIDVDFHSTGREAERLPAPIETALYRIVQEALTNVLTHAHAERVSLILERRRDHVLAIVEDNGCGFDVEAVMQALHPERHLGLLGMHERAAMVGGTVSLESTPGAGTTVFVRIPLPPSAPGGGPA
jgi:signal transduction histidine kinase